MSEVQTVCACIHEMTHATLHNYEKQRMEAAAGDPDKEPPKPKTHQIEEIEAESTSYMVCQYFGIETGENSFGYVASYCKDRELSELRACLNTINKAAGGMISGIEKHFAEVCKEQGIDLSEQKRSRSRHPRLWKNRLWKNPPRRSWTPSTSLPPTSTSLPLILTLMSIGTKWRTRRLR